MLTRAFSPREYRPVPGLKGRVNIAQGKALGPHDPGAYFLSGTGSRISHTFDPSGGTRSARTS
jgi:hypothetical protein